MKTADRGILRSEFSRTIMRNHPYFHSVIPDYARVIERHIGCGQVSKANREVCPAAFRTGKNLPGTLENL